MKKRNSILRALYLQSPTKMERGFERMSNPFERNDKTEAMKEADKSALINEKSKFNLRSM